MKLRVVLSVLLALVLCFACAQAETIDYAKTENWAFFGDGEDAAVDVFFVAPTVDLGEDGSVNMSLENEDRLHAFLGATQMEKGIFSPIARFYAPYYRQIALPVYQLSEGEQAPYLEIAYGDVRDAFLYYMEHENDGRPFLLAGFSQGAEHCIALLKEFFSDAAYADALIAAYCMGWRLTEEEVEAYPWIRPAQCADDLGTVIVFECEAPGTKGTLVVPEGMKTLSINPLNWKTDATPASKEENLGACFPVYDGSFKEEIPQLCGAVISPERGTVIVGDVTLDAYPNRLPVLGEGSFHLYDYQFYYRNLQQNVTTRVNAYLAAHAK